MGKVSFKNAKGLTLVGELWQASSDAIVIMAHGSGSNRRARGFFGPLAQALQQHNYTVLAFDFSGHGESDDAIVNMETAIDDLRSAVLFSREQGYTRLALFGHSYGAFACLKVYDSSIETMVLLGALAGPVLWRWEDVCTPEQLQELRTVGYVSEEVNDGLRKVIRYAGNTFKEIAEIDQKELLSRITCPMLLIHGDGEQQERDLLAATQKGMEFLPNNAELIIIPGAVHTFVNYIPQVVEYTVQWYAKYFPVR